MFNRSISSGVIIIGKRAFAVNLIWYTVEKRDLYKIEVTRYASQLGTNLVCHNKLKSGHQFGLADKSIGHRLSQPSLAAIVCKNLPANSIIAFEYEDRWIVISSSENKLVAIDSVFIDESEAKDFVCQYIYSCDCKNKYIPGSWGIDESNNEYDILHFISGRKCKITSIGRAISVKNALIFFILMALVGWGGYYYWMSSQVQYDELENNIKNEVDAPPPDPRDGLLMYNRFIQECYNAVGNYQFIASSVPGYRLMGSIYCEGNEVTFSLEKYISRDLSNLYLDSITSPPSSCKKDGNGMIIKWKIPFSKNDTLTPEKDKKTYPASIIYKELNLFFERYHIDGHVDDAQVISSSKNEVYSWYSTKFYFSTRLMPTYFIPYLYKYKDGLIVDHIEFDKQTHQWRVDGYYVSSER